MAVARERRLLLADNAFNAIKEVDETYVGVKPRKTIKMNKDVHIPTLNTNFPTSYFPNPLNNISISRLGREDA